MGEIKVFKGKIKTKTCKKSKTKHTKNRDNTMRLKYF